ncbi:putative disease resistance RPP13-like protein 1 [Malus domestica]|uniref:putative disease resistance RPP13-like protein 1 n=1 Tax=Malus domestica TaxID=3750 RepID=UPI0039757293
MAELVGGAFLSSFLSVLFDRIASRPVLDFISGKKNELLMRELKLKLLTADKLVDDAEEKQMTSPTVRKWLDDLKEAIYCLGELLDEIKAEALRRQLEGEDDHSPAASSSTSGISRSESNPSSPSDEFQIPTDFPIPPMPTMGSTPMWDHSNKEFNIGHKKELVKLLLGSMSLPSSEGKMTKKRALEALRLNDPTGPKIGVLPIVGMGGIGKSTLAQLVYKDVKGDFDVQAWVFVGGEIDILQIAQTIHGKITKNPCTITDLDLLSEELEGVLTGKKFLFVLDDVWSEDYLLWNNLMTHFNSCGGNIRGRFLVVICKACLHGRQCYYCPSVS